MRALATVVLVVVAGVCVSQAVAATRAPTRAAGEPTSWAGAPFDAGVDLLLRYDDRRGVWVDPVRWERRVVRFRFTGDVASPIVAEVREAFEWAEGPTGLALVEVEAGPAEIVVDAAPHNGGRTVWVGRPGVLEQVSMSVGCCRPAVAWHEALHALGLSHAGAAGHLMSPVGPVLPAGELERRGLEVLYGTG